MKAPFSGLALLFAMLSPEEFAAKTLDLLETESTFDVMFDSMEEYLAMAAAFRKLGCEVYGIPEHCHLRITKPLDKPGDHS